MSNRSRTLMDTLGMKVLEASNERVRMSMPIGPAVCQPYGSLHGGASLALAESAACLGASLHLDQGTHLAVGMEINANHLRPVRKGVVKAEATPLHVGRSSMVWDVRLKDEQERLVCVARCTVAIVPRPIES